MADISTFHFNKDNFDKIKAYKFGSNWPVVYVLENKNEAYIGQSINAYYRSKQHYENPERRKLNTMYVISDEEYNVSATLDIESWLIQYMAADGVYQLQNGNGGLKNHNYYDREKYKAKFELLWESLREQGVVKHTLDFIKNTDLFKYSPYKSLTVDQLQVAKEIVRDISSNKTSTFIVHGKPGTGKTILATYLCKYLQENKETKNLNVGLVVPMASLRGTISRVFSKIKGLKSGMVIGPNDVVKKPYDILIVDESHRLQRRKGIMGYGSYDQVNIKLGLDRESTQLDWITASSKFQIFMYDENQSVKPADVRPADFLKLDKKEYKINTQMRVGGGDEYINFIEDVFALKNPKTTVFNNYNFILFDDVGEMVGEIKKQDRFYKLCRVVSGYAWPWNTKPGGNSKLDYDIDIGGTKLIWNSTARDWVNSKNAVNEVGCIHTIQGYDLNYVGVIIGPELDYDPVGEKFVVDRNKYFDTNGRNGITDPLELELYIKNIYKTLLTRGMLGTYVYVFNDNLRKYIKDLLGVGNEDKKEKLIESPYQDSMVELPLYDSIGCGEAVFADSISHETCSVPARLISPGAKYFVLRTSGDSMNKMGIEDGDHILCQKNYHVSSGGVAVVMIGDDAVLKEIEFKKEGLLLKPRSTNSAHSERLLGEDDDFKVIGVFIAKIET